MSEFANIYGSTGIGLLLIALIVVCYQYLNNRSKQP